MPIDMNCTRYTKKATNQKKKHQKKRTQKKIKVGNTILGQASV